MAAGVVGRTSELDAVERFLHALTGGPAMLVLEGNAGIGKTTVMRAAIAAARERGVRVLTCVASASEARLAYTALADLLVGIEGPVIDRLPAPQREALEAALLRAGRVDSLTSDVDRRAVATAALSVFERLARDGPLVLAIDDLQWLDRPSARVIEFCARRLTDRVGLLASRRPGEAGAWAAELARLHEPESAVCRLAPLNAGDLQRVVREGLERPLERRALARVQAASGGNPFYALELARALPEDAPAATLPLPASLDDIVAARMAGLDNGAGEALLAAAALADPTIELLERALGPEAVDRLEEAERRGMIERHGRHLRFAHPLLATGVYARASSVSRRAMHRRLSAVATDVEERARHLALAGLPEAVGALGEAARHVLSRGAPDAAAELLELALGLGGGQDLRVRAAGHHFDAGDTRRARALLEEAIPALPAGEARARALMLLAEVRYKDDSFAEAHRLLQQARSEAGDDDRLHVMIDVRLVFTEFNTGLPPAAEEPARAALQRAERAGDPGLLAQALAVTAIVDFCLGRGIDDERLARACELARPAPPVAPEFSAEGIAAWVYLWAGQLDEARALVDAAGSGWAIRGEEHALAWMGLMTRWLDYWSGQPTDATADIDRLRLLGTAVGAGLGATLETMTHAFAGRVEEARRAGAEAIGLFERTGFLNSVGWVLTMLGFADLSIGDHETAAARLGPHAANAAATQVPEPTAGGWLFTGDAAESLIAVGRLEEAEPIVDWLEERGAALDRAWAIAVGARCRGLLLAVRGDTAGAEEALARALAAHDRLPLPLERARSLLVLGRILRLGRRRSAARQTLEEAVAVFEAAGSPRWAEQASAEIARLGLRPRVSDDLTPSEDRVARLAASGLTNREVAASLMVSPKTVEAHMARVYRKLGIRRRAELGAHMARREEPPLSLGQGGQVRGS